MSVYIGDTLIAGPSGTTDYNVLTNKPKINNVEIKGEISLDSLGCYTKAEVDNAFATHACTIYQDLISTTNNIALTASTSIYSYTITGDVTFTFDTSSLAGNVPGKIITFELYIPASATVGTITWPGSVKWLSGEVPSIEANNNYLLAFRSFDQGVNWIGNLQSYWS